MMCKIRSIYEFIFHNRYNMFRVFFLHLFLITSVLTSSPIRITVEHALTEEERAWGLMERTSLPEDHGMLFHFPSKKKWGFWMYNCPLPLSIAFIDDNQIVEIHEMEAYPDQSSPAFFERRKVFPSVPVNRALEMEKGWFRRRGVKPGDRLEWMINPPSATIIRKSERK